LVLSGRLGRWRRRPGPSGALLRSHRRRGTRKRRGADRPHRGGAAIAWPHSL